MARKRYAEGTIVGVARSRGQIETLLRTFGADRVQWTDEYERERSSTIRFAWSYEGTALAVRIKIVCDPEKLKGDAIDGRTNRFSPTKYEKLMERWSSESHRLLLLFLKAQFNAISAGLLQAEEVFLPFFEDSTGKTVWEVMSPRIDELPCSSSFKLLTDGE